MTTHSSRYRGLVKLLSSLAKAAGQRKDDDRAAGVTLTCETKPKTPTYTTINQLILECAESRWSIDIHFIETADPADRFALESAYIAAFSPPWNRTSWAEATARLHPPAGSRRLAPLRHATGGPERRPP